MREYIEIQTNKSKEVLDVTEKINALLKPEQTGLVNLFVLHTTAAVSCVDMDPGADLDFLDAFGKIVPKLDYRHPHDPGHFPDHVLSALVGVSITLPIENGELILGTWQRIVLMEFDGPRKREIVFSFLPFP